MNGGRIVILLVLLSVFTLGQAQVTIGTEAAPASGMLLQLKQMKEAGWSSANGYVNARKVVALHSVNLKVTPSIQGDTGDKLVA